MRKPRKFKAKTLPLLGSNQEYQRINPFCEVMTVEKYRSFPDNENLTDQQAQKEIEILSAVARIFMDYLKTQGDQAAQKLSIGGQQKIAA